MEGSSHGDDSHSYKYVHSGSNFNDDRSLSFWQERQTMPQREPMAEHPNLECISQRNLQKSSKKKITHDQEGTKK